MNTDAAWTVGDGIVIAGDEDHMLATIQFSSEWRAIPRARKLDLLRQALSQLAAVTTLSLFLASPASAQTGMSALGWVPLVAGQGADVATTYAALQHPGVRETNPLYTRADGSMSWGKLATVKASTIAGSWLLGRILPRKAANALGIIVGATGAIPAAHNVRVIRRQP